MLFVGQLLVGVGVGVDFPVSSTYISEVLPKRSRARMMVATIACQSVGMLLAAAITLLLLKNAGNAQNWRLFWRPKASSPCSFSCYVCRNRTVRIG
jgi:MFS transporter, putative metabolite transport protein